MAHRYDFSRRPKANPKSVVSAGEGSKYRFTVLTERLLRYEWSDDGAFEDRASTFAVFRWFDEPKYRVVDAKDSLEIITDFFHLTYDKKEFTPDGLVLTVGGQEWRYDGQNHGDLGGTARTLDGIDGRIELEPGVLSRRSYAVLDDSKSMLFDEKGWVATRLPGRKDGYVFAYGGDHKAAIKDFYRLSGGQPLLPRWALGNWWSRYHEYSADEYLELMDHFAKEGIPLTVGVLDMDWHKVNIPPKYGSGWTGYSWNRDLFPDPEGFLRELHNRGLKVTVNDHPAGGVRAFEDQYEDVAKALGFDTSHGDPIKFDCTNKEYLDAYFDVLKANLEAQGIDFWWIDWQQGTRTKIPGIDPLWVLNHYHYLTSKRDVSKLGQPITFSRFAGPGSHRYPIGFSGDTVISWASLHFQPEFTATASNIGYGWWSHDIGGHYWGTRSNELTARWVQLGCFSPVLRLHSEKSQWNSKAPWRYEPRAHAVMREFLIFRRRLVPFLYTMSVRATRDAEPLVQPMYWAHARDDAAYSVPNQYYFGPDLIVAPITAPHSSITLLGGVRAWLPPGRYVDIFRPELVYDGGRHVHLHRALETIPVLAREGTILPLDISRSVQENGTPLPTHLEILLVVGKDAFFELVEDDEKAGTGAHGTEDTFVRTPIRWEQRSGKLTIGPASKPSSRAREWTVRLVGHTAPADAPLPTGMARLSPQDETPYCTAVRLGSAAASSPLEVNLGENLQLDIVDVPARLHEMLHRCESAYRPKEAVWRLVTADERPVHVRMAALYEMEEVDEAVREAVVEIWFADGRALAAGTRAAGEPGNSRDLGAGGRTQDGEVAVRPASGSSSGSGRESENGAEGSKNGYVVL